MFKYCRQYSRSGSVVSVKFRPPGLKSRAVSQRYGSALPSSSKNSRKTLISTLFWLLYDFLSLKNDVNVPSKSNKQKNLDKKIILCWRLEGQWRKDQDPDPLVRDKDPRIRILNVILTVGVPERGLRSRADRDCVHVGARVGEILQLVDEVLDLLRIHVSHLSQRNREQGQSSNLFYLPGTGTVSKRFKLMQSCGPVKFWYGSVPLTNGTGLGSGSCYFRQWPSRHQHKKNF